MGIAAIAGRYAYRGYYALWMSWVLRLSLVDTRIVGIARLVDIVGVMPCKYRGIAAIAGRYAYCGHYVP